MSDTRWIAKGINTVQLGQFTDEHANVIAGLLEAAGIA